MCACDLAVESVEAKISDVPFSDDDVGDDIDCVMKQLEAAATTPRNYFFFHQGLVKKGPSRTFLSSIVVFYDRTHTNNAALLQLARWLTVSGLYCQSLSHGILLTLQY